MAFRENTGEIDLFDGMFASMPANETLRHINALVDWAVLRRTLAPAWDQSGVGNPGFDPVVLAKMLLLESLYELSDVRVSTEAADRLSFREFLGLGAGADVPDDTTLVRFRNRLRGHGLMHKVEEFFAGELRRHGLAMRPGSIAVIDASLIPAATNPPRGNDKAPTGESAKGQGSKGDRAPMEKRDHEAGFAKRKKKTVFGYKLHVKSDAKSGLIDTFEVTAANVHDTNVFESLLTGTEGAVMADKAYDSSARREKLRARKIHDWIMHRAARNKPLETCFKEINRLYAPMRSSVERQFAHLKRWRGCGRARFIGLARVREQMMWGIAAHNLMRATKLMA
jgi:IS5 family transposase